ncbi:predicted protein [Plenodomus lingam JN3]|uniref:Predicted protein n=1 Tax=Leptosphaeria maculans (strain JN3 / isolate v23.1.3 / race Av1-4-5-6-7-8) TaxID=985895 RepID=E4ZI18_LEPMJ|nr:predicted protein [Plenodomus lingam JN3]CBX91161.1 predicted protein [Plenodomus lingam JN3]
MDQSHSRITSTPCQHHHLRKADRFQPSHAPHGFDLNLPLPSFRLLKGGQWVCRQARYQPAASPAAALAGKNLPVEPSEFSRHGQPSDVTCLPMLAPFRHDVPDSIPRVIPRYGGCDDGPSSANTKLEGGVEEKGAEAAETFGSAYRVATPPLRKASAAWSFFSNDCSCPGRGSSMPVWTVRGELCTTTAQGVPDHTAMEMHETSLIAHTLIPVPSRSTRSHAHPPPDTASQPSASIPSSHPPIPAPPLPYPMPTTFSNPPEGPQVLPLPIIQFVTTVCPQKCRALD